MNNTHFAHFKQHFDFSSELLVINLTHFNPMFYFYIPLETSENLGFIYRKRWRFQG